MSKRPEESWLEANRRYLAAMLAEVREALERHAEAMGGEAPPTARRPPPAGPAWATGTPPALESLCQTFGLSRFERAVLLLTVGVELEGGFAALCAAAQADPSRAYPTFGLALAALPEAAWEALTPAAPLRHWRLIEVGPGPSLAASPLRIDERILHHLVGVDYQDERLAGLAEPLPPAGELVPSHRALAERLAATWRRTAGSPDFPIVQLAGDEVAGKRAIAAGACAELGLRLCRMPADALPTSPAELESLARLWQREAILSGSVLLLDCDSVEAGEAVREGTVQRFLESTRGALIVSSRLRRRPRERPLLTFDVGKPTLAEQRAVWEEVLGAGLPAANGQVETLVSQFNLNLPTIHAAYAGALGHSGAKDRPEVFAAQLWDTCRLQARPRLEDMAQRIEPAAGWADLVLPEAALRVLREIAAQLHHRGTVYGRWGFGARGARGLGLSALFAGASGTGKTMAAEVLAGEINLDLYRIDLSSVVSKYIGETEKNLKQVFDAAEEGGAVLLFDEADALFGKRSEVKDSHDRHANIEVSYLLQRMEAYRGLAILTTNLKDALDSAFLRRLRFVIEFPFPNPALRAEIWRRVFPPETPTRGIDAEKLGRLNVTGGNIRNIAMNAAFLAAAEGQPVAMGHLLRAARAEHAKLEKPLPEAETKDW